MKKQYESPDFLYRMVSFTDVLSTSQDQVPSSDIGGPDPGGGFGGGNEDDGGW